MTSTRKIYLWALTEFAETYWRTSRPQILNSGISKRKAAVTGIVEFSKNKSAPTYVGNEFLLLLSSAPFPDSGPGWGHYCLPSMPVENKF